MSQTPPPITIDWTEQHAFLGRSLYVWQVNFASLLAVLFVFVAFVGFYFSSPFLPLLVRHLGVTDPRVGAIWSGVLIGLGPASAVIASPVWGRLADRIGERLLLVRTVFGFALLNGLCAVATTVWQLAALRLLMSTLGGRPPCVGMWSRADGVESHGAAVGGVARRRRTPCGRHSHARVRLGGVGHAGRAALERLWRPE